MENKIMQILNNYRCSYDGSIVQKNFEKIVKDITVEFKLINAELEAKIYAYEKIIANSNFKPIITTPLPYVTQTNFEEGESNE